MRRLGIRRDRKQEQFQNLALVQVLVLIQVLEQVQNLNQFLNQNPIPNC